MTRFPRPRVVVLDDRPAETKRRLRGLDRRASVQVLTKDDLFEAKFPRCDLLLVDYDLAGWIDSTGQGESLRVASTGVSLGLNVIQMLERRDREQAPLLVLLSGKATEFPPALCQQIEFDWALSKNQADLTVSLRSLATWRKTVPAPPTALVAEFGDDLWLDLLRVPRREAVRERVRWSLEGTERPRPTKTRSTSSRTVAAWILQRLIGYPGPLWASTSLCAHLGMASWVKQSPRARQAIERLFARARYSGPFADVDGGRWWKPLAEDVSARIGKSAPTTSRAFRECLRELVPEVRFSSEDGLLVPLVDEIGMQTGSFAPVKDVARVAPFGWPGNADPAFMLKADVAGDHSLAAPYANAGQEGSQ